MKLLFGTADRALRAVLGPAILLLVVTAAAPTAAQTTWFSPTLSGDRVTGDPGDGDGWGVAAIGVDGDTTRYYIWVTDIAAPTAAHVHPGVAGANGGVAIDLEASFTEVSNNTYVAQGVVSGGSTAALLDTPGAFYVNVHNADHPAGAVRGQVLGDGAARSSLAGTLRGFRQVGSSGDPDGDGFAVVTFDDNTAHFYFNAENVATPTAAHIHMGTAAENGPVVIDTMAVFTDGVSRDRGRGRRGSGDADPRLAGQLLLQRPQRRPSGRRHPRPAPAHRNRALLPGDLARGRPGRQPVDHGSAAHRSRRRDRRPPMPSGSHRAPPAAPGRPPPRRSLFTPVSSRSSTTRWRLSSPPTATARSRSPRRNRSAAPPGSSTTSATIRRSAAPSARPRRPTPRPISWPRESSCSGRTVPRATGKAFAPTSATSTRGPRR